MADASALPMPVPATRPAINPWIIAMTVTLATFMEVLDSSIANVALLTWPGRSAPAPTRAHG
jgi:DHA2 family multidrug resistance protein